MNQESERFIDRRTVLRGAGVAFLAATISGSVVARDIPVATYAVPLDRWVTTTASSPWQIGGQAVEASSRQGLPGDVEVMPGEAYQTIEGFGGCFNEMGWDAIRLLSQRDQEVVLNELFGDAGMALSLCRTPIAANDFSRDWYSYDDTSGDFALKDFSVAHDEATLIPFIHAAQRVRPDLALWASPWSPPAWMKANGHYAAVANLPGRPDNGLRSDQVGAESTDMFIQDARYFDAYARYFGRYVDEYDKRGIRIGMVMPQNEFNSAQPFPSCCWTPAGLARFLPHLGREMGRRGVDVFFGTLERPNERLFEQVYQDAAAGSVLSGVGVQWAGRTALPIIADRHPTLRFYMSEQECGDGRNDWRYARYAWGLMKYYLNNGCSGYDYWNFALVNGGISRWGWAQNSLLSVDRVSRQYAWNHEFYLLKHVAGLVRPGARRIKAVSWTGYEDVLAFRNRDGTIAVVAHNPLTESMPIRIGVGARMIATTLAPDSFSSVLLGG